MGKILSIIIPTYNMENYLNQCVMSLVQSKFISDIEILIVNDGSKDNTLKLAESLRIQFPNTINIIDKENGGHGSTINAGTAKCLGKYFKVIDADDWVDTEEFDKLIEKLYEVDVDCVICNYTSVYEEDNKSVLNDVTSKFEVGQVINYDDYIKNTRLAMHSVVYKTALYRDSNIKLTEKCFYVDTEFIYYPLLNFKTIICYPFNVYQYRLQRVGQSVSREGFLKHIDDHRKVMLELCHFYDSISSQNTAIKQFLEIEIAGHLSYQLSFIISKNLTKSEWQTHKTYIRQIKKLEPKIYKKLSLKHRFINTCPVWLVRITAKIFCN